MHLDITSAQFNGPEVYMSPHSFDTELIIPDSIDHYYNTNIFKIREELFKSGWSDCDVLGYSKIKKISEKIISKINLTNSPAPIFAGTCI